MGSIIKVNIRGNILEPLVALTLVVLSLTSCFTIVLKTKNNFNVVQVNNANIVAGEILHSSLQEHNFTTDVIKYNGLIINKNISWYDREKSLLKIEIYITDIKNNILASRVKVIIYEEEYNQF